MSQQLQCNCGSIVSEKGYNTHCKTNKHLAFLARGLAHTNASEYRVPKKQKKVPVKYADEYSDESCEEYDEEDQGDYEGDTYADE